MQTDAEQGDYYGGNHMRKFTCSAYSVQCDGATEAGMVAAILQDETRVVLSHGYQAILCGGSGPGAAIIYTNPATSLEQALSLLLDQVRLNRPDTAQVVLSPPAPEELDALPRPFQTLLGCLWSAHLRRPTEDSEAHTTMRPLGAIAAATGRLRLQVADMSEARRAVLRLLSEMSGAPDAWRAPAPGDAPPIGQRVPG